MSSEIEWTDATWNPVTGCDRVSPGCDHCYALTMAKRLKAMGNPKYQNDGNPTTSGPGFGATFHEDTLGIPAGWRKPRRIFVNSMADLFHTEIADYEIAKIFAVAARYPRHTFQILTKRHARMRSLVGGDLYDLMAAELTDGYDPIGHKLVWPLPNVWLGVSVEDQQWANIRIPALLDTPAAVRFISAEPLLGEVSMFANSTLDNGTLLDWVIVGGESGRGARPMHPSWARGLRDECNTYGIPFLFKQWGSHDEHGQRMSKHAAGRLLDGRTWDEYPAGAA
jgi:protein gp37